MKKFIIHQNYTEHGTNYYEVEANSLEEAIDKVNNLQCEIVDSDCWDYECDFTDSHEIKEIKK